jgi:acetyl esterase/lipase
MTSSEDILSLAPPAADLRLAYGGDRNQFLDLRLPVRKGPSGLAIAVHGGYWRARYDLAYMGHLCAALTARGIATANLEYRRVGNAGGGWPGTFADVQAAYQFLTQLSGKNVSGNIAGDVSKNARRYEFDLRRVVVIGHSAGGQLGLCLAARESGVKAAISLAGVVDLQRAYELHLSNDAVVEFLGGTPAEVGDHYREADPMRLAVGARQWLVHGAADDVVPPAFSGDYVAAKKKRKEDARLVEIAGAGHFDVVDPRARAWGDVERVVMEAVE